MAIVVLYTVSSSQRVSESSFWDRCHGHRRAGSIVGFSRNVTVVLSVLPSTGSLTQSHLDTTVTMTIARAVSHQVALAEPHDDDSAFLRAARRSLHFDFALFYRSRSRDGVCQLSSIR